MKLLTPARASRLKWFWPALLIALLMWSLNLALFLLVPTWGRWANFGAMMVIAMILGGEILYVWIGESVS